VEMVKESTFHLPPSRMSIAQKHSSDDILLRQALCLHERSEETAQMCELPKRGLFNPNAIPHSSFAHFQSGARRYCTYPFLVKPESALLGRFAKHDI
jgi:hypothetical protein